MVLYIDEPDSVELRPLPELTNEEAVVACELLNTVFKEVLADRPVEDLMLSARAQVTLKRNKIKTIGDLLRVLRSKRAIVGAGPMCMAEYTKAVGGDDAGTRA